MRVALALLAEAVDFLLMVGDVFIIEVTWLILILLKFEQVVRDIEHVLPSFLFRLQLCNSSCPSLLDFLVGKGFFGL